MLIDIYNRVSFPHKDSAIYSALSSSDLESIKSVNLPAQFSTKVDNLARHLIWLREADPGAKSIIYSQFKDFLDVLESAFEKFRIGYSSIDKRNGIEKFKDDPAIECFLLHSRAHSAGLTLVNASHVFICEPLLNVALELQAIARVDRIGQQHETAVYVYLAEGTVEESIHKLSVARRLEHMGQTDKGKESGPSPGLGEGKLEAANSMELQQASLDKLHSKGVKNGEAVGKDDLWECLFGNVAQENAARKAKNDEIMGNMEVRRHLFAGAAEDRGNAEGSSSGSA